MSLRVVLAGGGTAGHVNPLLATAHVLRTRGAQVKVLGTEEGLESKLVPEDGFELAIVPKVPIPRKPSTDLFSVPTRLNAAVSSAEKVITGADAVVGFGGYVAAPAYIAAKRLNIPFVVHEQNVRAGWANRLGARSAAAVALTFPNTVLRARNGVTRVTGMPLRRKIMDLARARQSEAGRAETKEIGARIFGLDAKKPTLLVTGGSLGAQHLNEVLIEAAPKIKKPVQVLHVTGHGKADEVRVAAAAPRIGFAWEIAEYVHNMDEAMAASDLVLCRSGAGTVSELQALGIPAFYVPLPIGNGEQRLNAQAQVKAGGARIVDDKFFTASTLIHEVIPLLKDKERLDQMGQASRELSPGDGAELLADLIEEVA